MKLKELMEKYGYYEVTGIFDNDGDKPNGYVNVGLKRSVPKTIWGLKKGSDYYYYVDEDGEVVISTWYDWDCDRNRLNIGNAFLTEEDAEKDVERRKVETLLLKHGGRRWFKCDIANWVIRYNHLRSSFEYGYTKCTQHQSCIYFDTKEEAEKAIKEIGEERLKKALFEVKEE